MATEQGWVRRVTPVCVSVTVLPAPCPLVQTERAQLEDGRFVYRLLRSPMCEYLVNFLHKLRQLPERYMMNSVLENFTILQVIRWGWARAGTWMWGVGVGAEPNTDPRPGELTQWALHSILMRGCLPSLRKLTWRTHGGILS